VSALANASTRSGIGEVIRGLLATTEPYFQAEIWAYYNARKTRVVFSKWFITIRLSDLRFLIEEIAGPEPAPN